jgi:LCP family protein required for cell wall assembly
VVLAGAGWINHLRDVAEGTLTRSDAIPTGADNGGGQDVDGTAVNLLLVGRDSRAGISAKDLHDKLHTEAEGTNQTDTMMLVHIPADGARVSVVSFPRDSLVEEPGIGMRKLNNAYNNGMAYFAPAGGKGKALEAAGQRYLVRTISKLTGLHIDHYVEVGLLAFYNLTNVLGGIVVNLCEPVKEANSGVDLPAGKQRLFGAEALSFVRQREGLEKYGGDLQRIKRQQYFIGAVVRKILSSGVLLNPAQQENLIKAVAKNLTLDRGLDLFQLAGQLQNLAAGNVEFRTIPLADPPTSSDGGEDYVNLADLPTVHAFFATLSTDPTTGPSSAASSSAANSNGSAPSSGASDAAPSSGGANGGGATGAPPTASKLPAPNFTAADTSCIH